MGSQGCFVDSILPSESDNFITSNSLSQQAKISAFIALELAKR